MSDEQKNTKDESEPTNQKEEDEGSVDNSQKSEEPKKTRFFGNDCKDCEKHKKERDEYKEGWQRALADYKNLQSEIEKRRGEWVKMSELQILEEFIPVYDNFKKAFAHVGNGGDSWSVGIEYIKKQFGEILRAHGVEEIKTVGEKFDPNLHEAMGEEVDDDKAQGTIIKEVDGGYKMGNRVIKAAKVIISKT